MLIRTFLTATVCLLYWGVFIWYIFELTNCGHDRAVLIYNWDTFILLVFAVADWKCGFVSNLHEQFNLLAFLTIIANFVLIIFVHSKIIANNSQLMFWCFNGTEFVITSCIVIYSYRYGFFKQE